MADIDEKEAAQTIKLVGSNLNGEETNYLDVDENGRFVSAEAVYSTFITGLKTVGSVTPIKICVGADNLINRQSISFFNKGSQDLYMGDSSVTALTGIPVTNEEVVSLDKFGFGVDIYVIAKAVTSEIVIWEFS